jgi:HK97 family phage portal protein
MAWTDIFKTGNRGYSEQDIQDVISRSINDTLRIANLAGYQTSPYATNINKNNALSLSAVWACVQLLSDTFASLPYHAYKATAQGSETVPSLDVVKLIAKNPVETMTPFVWRKLAMSRLLLDGNFYAYIERDGNYKPKRLIPINGEVEITEVDGELFYRFKSNDKEFIKSAENILHLKGYSDDGIYGKSVLQAHRDSFAIGLSATKASKDFYEKGAKLDGYLSTDLALKEDTYKRVKESFNNRNDERVPLLDAGMKYYPLKLNPQDAQYIESRKFTELDIARIFGVPPHMIGILDRATWNNVEALGIEFAKYTMLPICVNWEQELDTKLLKESDKDTIYTRFNLEGIMRADMKTRYESYKLGIQNGFMSINEARALENRNPVEGGDKHFVQGNNMVDINEINGLIDNNND